MADITSPQPVIQASGSTVTVVPSGTQNISGTVTLSSQTVTLSSQTVTLSSQTVTCVQSTAANLKVDPSSVTSPISGTVTANAGTGTFNTITIVNDTTSTGTVTNANDTVSVTLQGSQGAAAVVTGTWTGTLTPEITVDGSNWNTTAVSVFDPTAGASFLTAVVVNGTYLILGIGGCQKARFRLSTATSGTATITFRTTQATSQFDVQPVRGTGTAGLPASEIITIQGITSMTPVKVDGSGVTQPVSGTVTLSSATVTLSSATVTCVPSGTQVVSGTVTLSSQTVTLSSQTVTLSSQTVTAVGDVASGASDSGNPVKQGAYAVTALPTAVTNAQRVNLVADKFGRQVVLPYSIRDLTTIGTVTLTTTTETTVLTAVASTFLDVTALQLSNASNTGVRVDIRDSTGGTVRFSFYLAASGGGVAQSFTVPVPQATVNNNWTAQLSAAVTDVRVTLVSVSNK